MTDINKVTPLAYRPLEYDDWGVIRGADGRLFAHARSDAYLSVVDADAHRDAGTDPYEAIGRLIVKVINERDELIAASRDSRRSLAQIGAMCGNPNAIEACRLIVNLAKQAIAEIELTLARAESSDAQ